MERAPMPIPPDPPTEGSGVPSEPRDEHFQCSGVACPHKFVHLNTRCWLEYAGYRCSYYYRVDTFFCEKCLTYEEKKFHSTGEKYPDWWVGDK